MKKLLFAVLASAALLWACDGVEIPALLDIPEESLEYFNHGVNFSATSAEGTLTVKIAFTSSLSWSASVVDAGGNPVSWLTVSPSSGQPGPTEITITAQDNTSVQQRSAIVNVSCGVVAKSLNVTQAALPQTPTVTIEVAPTSAQMTIGQTLQLNATVLPESAAGVTVSWSSSNPEVATVTPGNGASGDGTPIHGGLVKAIGEGEAVITAKAGESEAQCVITVVKKSEEGRLIVTPDKVTIVKNEKLQLSVTDEEGKAVKATWSTTDNLVAVVDENNLLEARNPGSAIVTATADGKTGTCEVTVTDEIPVESIAFNPDYIEMNVGDERQLTVVFTPENATDKTINRWVVLGGNPTVTVDENGVVKAVQKGTATVRAAIDPQRMADCTIKVIDPDNPDIPVESIVLDKTEATVATKQADPLILTATVTPADVLKSKSIEWKSSNPANVMVTRMNDTQAKVVGLTEGSKETVTANIGGKSASCEITVEKTQSGVEVTSISVSPTSLELNINETAQLTATVLPESAAGVTVTWSSYNPDVAYVTNGSASGSDGSSGGESSKGGMVLARTAGSATITASAGGKSATCQVTVKGGGGSSSTLERVSIDPTAVTLALNEEKSLTLVLQPADADVTIYWESVNSSIAKVQMTSKTTAKVQGISVGQTQLIAHAGDMTAICQVTVESGGDEVPVESVTLNVHELNLGVNGQFQLVATVLPENATDKGVSWSSNVQSSKLYIDTNGKVSGLQPCEATVTVRCRANPYIYDTCKITVTKSSSGSDE